MKQNLKIRKTKINYALAASVSLVSIFASCASLKTWPVLDGDAPAYFSPAVELSQGRGLTNPTWLPPLNDSIDGPGGRRYTYHGFVYPLLIGWLGKLSGGGATPCLAWMHFFNLITSLICAIGILGFCRQQDGFRKILSFILPLFFFALCEAYAGRPEPAVFLLMSLGLMAVQNLRGNLLSCVLSFLCGLVFFASPAIGVLSLLPLLAFRTSQEGKISLLEITIGFASFVAALALCLFFYPYPPLDWLHGVWRHSRINLSLPQGQGFLQTWVTRAQTPLLLLSFGIVALMALRRIILLVRSQTTYKRYGVMALLALFMIGLSKVAFSKTEASYNAVVWFPILLALLPSMELNKFFNGALLFALVLPVLGLARSSFVLIQQFKAEAVSFQEIQDVILAKQKDGIQISSGLFLAAPDPRQVSFGNGKAQWRLEQQTNRGVSRPPEISVYRLVKNRFGSPIQILGLLIARTPGGWEYALYRKVD